jgi:hypothetical protein
VGDPIKVVIQSDPIKIVILSDPERSEGESKDLLFISYMKLSHPNVAHSSLLLA